MVTPAPGIDVGSARRLTAMAAFVSALVAIALPTSYFMAERLHTFAHLQARADQAAMNMETHIGRNAATWQDEPAMLGAIVAQVISRSVHVEWQLNSRVIDRHGQVMTQDGPVPDGPILEASADIIDGGMAVGVVSLCISLRPLLWTTALIALGSGLLGLLMFTMLRNAPLRLLNRAVSRAAHLATHDPLTGLPNRVLFRDRLGQALPRLRRDGGTVAVLCLDLDRFKPVNDTLGHAAGDLLLRQAAERISSALRQTDTLARLGGDEFAIIQVGARQPADAEALARRIIAAIAPPFDLTGHRAEIGVSIGIALRSEGGIESVWPSAAEALLLDADLALYRAKEEARGSYRFFEPDMNQRLAERRALEADMRAALAAGQFMLHYQPQIALRGRELVGAEALLRWQHPQRGLVPPAEFIPLAEETGLIQQLGAWVLQQACREAAGWPATISVAVNVSPIQFRRPGFIDSVEAALRDSDLDPARLELEITEGVLLHDTHETLLILDRLRRLGVQIAMDDFGTGYSSLGYLQKFAFDKIKIDRSFIARLEQAPQAGAIVTAVLGMGRALSIRVNAEGVETMAQADVLTAEGCAEAQGYLFSKPLPASAFRDLAWRDAARPVVAAPLPQAA